MEWLDRSFVVGMPHMVPEQLSEVELLKIVGDAQWQNISQVLETPSTRIANDHGERLYASFMNIDVSFAPKTPMAFGEGTEIHLRHACRFYSRRFVEGFFCFDDAPLLGTLTDHIGAREDLEKLGVPWIYVTNAFVTRDESNLRLRTFAPVGAEYGREFMTEVAPPGIRDHASVECTGHLTLPGIELAVPVDTKGYDEIVYDVVPESDLNGAGLLYFARYVAVVNYGERLFLRRCSQVELSSRLIALLSTVRRRLFYFANATEHDSIQIRVKARVTRPEEGASASATSVSALRFYFDTELRRRSDGALMARSIALKHLVIAKRLKSLVLEAGRIEQQLGLGSA